MLISRRKEGESLLIGDSIEVRIVAIKGKKVTLGVVAPREVKISSAKLTAIALANTLAATHSAFVDSLLQPGAQPAEKPVLLLKPFSPESGVNGR